MPDPELSERFCTGKLPLRSFEKTICLEAGSKVKPACEDPVGDREKENTARSGSVGAAALDFWIRRLWLFTRRAGAEAEAGHREWALVKQFLEP
jgi:hypothetical protein